MKKYVFPFQKKNKHERKPVIIDPADYQREPLTGRIVHKKPSFKTRLLLALQIAAGVALGIGIFLLLLPIALFLAVVVVSFALAFLAILWWKMRKHRDLVEEWRNQLERLFGREQGK